MKISSVGHDVGVTEGLTEIRYAVDDDGRYVQVGSSGWEPINVANTLAWEQVRQVVAEAAQQVVAGKTSPLAYYMAVNQMDINLLAQYMGMARWRVKRHLKPKVFKRLRLGMLARYALLFKISPEVLAEGKLLPPNFPQTVKD